MINISNIIYKNIMSVGNSPIEMVLDQHNRTLITGTNGAGKSTFLEALCFGLFGKPFRKIKKPQLLNSVNKRNLLVEVDLQDGKHKYKIIRGMKPNKFEIYKDGDIIEESASIADYQEYLEKHILRMSLNTFKQIVVLGTAGYTPFMLLNTSQRRSIIEDLLDISIFSTMGDLNKQQIKTIQEEIKDKDSCIERLMSEIKIHTQYEKERRLKSKERLGELTSELESTVREYHDILDRIADMTSLLDTKTLNLIESVQTEFEECAELMATYKAEIVQAKKTKDFIQSNDHCSTCKQPITDEHKCHVNEETTVQIKDITQKYKTASSQLKELAEQAQSRKTAQSEIQDLRSDIRTATSEKDMTYKQAERIKNDIVAIKSDDEQTDKSQEIKSLASDIKEIDKDKQSQMHEKHCRDVVAGILKDSGVKKMIIRKYIPSINSFINSYLKQLGANYNFTLDEEFNETIKSRGRDNFSYESFSQGERARIDLAILFSFRDLVKARTGSSTNLLGLDEVFDSAADTDGVNDINKILSNMKDNIIIISHNEKHDKESFDRHIRFRKVGNFTREG